MGLFSPHSRPTGGTAADHHRHKHRHEADRLELGKRAADDLLDENIRPYGMNNKGQAIARRDPGKRR